MSLRNFCTVCRIPYEGELEEPHRKDVDGFVNTITVGIRRRVPMRESLVYTFPFYATLPYLLVDA